MNKTISLIMSLGGFCFECPFMRLDIVSLFHDPEMVLIYFDLSVNSTGHYW